MKNCRRHGFTLIELMIVVAIIGILAAIVIPQYGNLVAKSQEGTTKANLGTIRSALSIYFGDNDGWNPIDSNSLISLTAAGKYLIVIPPIVVPKTTSNIGHPTSAAVVNTATDAGGLVYGNGGPGLTTWGTVVVNCSHQDLQARVWSTN